MNVEKPPIIKIVIVGDHGVGKSNICSQFSRGEFKLGEKPTVGVEFVKRTIVFEGRDVDIQIWDTAGQEKFSKICSPFYRAAVGALLVFDLTNPDSFAAIKKWKKEIVHNADPQIKFHLIGNKSDLRNLRGVIDEDIEYLIEEETIKYSEVSALTGEGIETAFTEIVNEIMGGIGQKLLDTVETHSVYSDPAFRVSVSDSEKKPINNCTC